MKDVSEKWKLLAENLRKQNREIHIKAFRDFLETSHIVDKYFEIFEDRVELNRTERLIILLLLAKCDYMTPTEISKIAIRPVDTIIKSVDGLDKKGVIRSSQSKSDRRLRKVILTEKGLKMAGKNLLFRELSFCQGMSCFNKAEAKIFASYLKKFREQISHVIANNAKIFNKSFTSNLINDPLDKFFSSH